MATSMAWQKTDRQSVNFSEQHLVGRLPPRALDAAPLRFPEPRQIIKAASANKSKYRLGHLQVHLSLLPVSRAITKKDLVAEAFLIQVCQICRRPSV
mgnify:CR=1 FL=1